MNPMTQKEGCQTQQKLLLTNLWGLIDSMCKNCFLKPSAGSPNAFAAGNRKILLSSLQLLGESSVPNPPDR